MSRRGSDSTFVLAGAGTYLDMFLQVLGTFEGLPTEVTFVWFERDVDADMGRDMVTFDGCGPALIPAASQVEVVGTFSTNMLFANVFLVVS